MGMTKGLAGALLALLVAGCSSPAEKVVKEYLNQKKCVDRTQFILQPEKNKKALERWYKNNKDCVTKGQGMDASDCKNTQVGAYCTVSFKKGPGPYCLKREKTGFKIDWPCSVGYSEMPLKVFKADHPTKPVLMRVWAKLSDDYADQTPRDKFLSVALADKPDSYDDFFIAKRRVVEATGMALDFPPAAALYKLLADGDAHKVMVDVEWTGQPTITWVVQDNWKSLTDAEWAAMKKKRETTLDQFWDPGLGDSKKLTKCCDALKLSAGSGTCVGLELKVMTGKVGLDAAIRQVVDSMKDKDKLPEACSKLQ